MIHALVDEYRSVLPGHQIYVKESFHEVLDVIVQSMRADDDRHMDHSDSEKVVFLFTDGTYAYLKDVRLNGAPVDQNGLESEVYSHRTKKERVIFSIAYSIARVEAIAWQSSRVEALTAAYEEWGATNEYAKVSLKTIHSLAQHRAIRDWANHIEEAIAIVDKVLRI